MAYAFVPAGKGRNMPAAHMFAASNGVLLEVKPTDPACEVISDAVSFREERLCAAMTRFQNALGGRVVVMGMTLENNRSQSLFNYRRQRLLQDLLVWCADRYVFVREAPDVFTIQNEARDPAASGFFGMVTLISLCEDPLDEVRLHLPPRWREAKAFRALDRAGRWQPVTCERDGCGLCVRRSLGYLEPLCLLAE